MDLLGPGLLIVLGGVAVVVPAATYWMWNRVRGPQAVRVASRLSLLVAGQVAAVLFVAAAANDYGVFYGSWGELFGTANSAPGPLLEAGGPGIGVGGHWTPHRGSAFQILGQYGHEPASAFPHLGEILKVRLGGPTGLSEVAYVSLPAQYFQPAYAGMTFPAAEVFTGYPGNARNLLLRLHYPDVLGRDVRANQTHPFVLVMLRPTVTFPRDTECINVPGGPQAETYFAHDVVMDITRHFRVREKAWGAIGDSTGGWCSVLLAFHHPDTFPAAVSMSGYFHPLRDLTTGDLFGGSSILRNLDNPEWLMAHGHIPPIAILATAGRAERGPFGYADLLTLRSLARSPMTLDTQTLPGSGHNFDAWGRQLPTDLAWLGQHLWEY